MSGWRWVSMELVLAVHGRQIAEHGGADGIRDRATIESTLARPQSLALNETPDAAQLGSADAFGLAKNHGFVDGNKRVAWIAMRVFLMDNGHRLEFDQIDAIDTMLKLTSGELTESEFSCWMRQRFQSCSLRSPRELSDCCLAHSIYSGLDACRGCRDRPRDDLVESWLRAEA